MLREIIYPAERLERGAVAARALRDQPQPVLPKLAVKRIRVKDSPDRAWYKKPAVVVPAKIARATSKSAPADALEAEEIAQRLASADNSLALLSPASLARVKASPAYTEALTKAREELAAYRAEGKGLHPNVRNSDLGRRLALFKRLGEKFPVPSARKP